MYDHIIYVTYYFRIRNGNFEFVRSHFRRPWGSVCARARIMRRRRSRIHRR